MYAVSYLIFSARESVINYVINCVKMRATCNCGVFNNKEDQVFTSSLLRRYNIVVTGGGTSILIQISIELMFIFFSAKSYCHPNPCLHGGKCNDNKNGYECRCIGSYRGVNCEGSVPFNFRGIF